MSDCGTGFGNTGTYPACTGFKAIRGCIVVPTTATDGTPNVIPQGTVIDDAYLAERLNDVDPSKRWYPLGGTEAATSVREDPTYFTNPSGALEFVKQGIRKLEFQLRQKGSEFLGQIKPCSCDQLSFFAIDIDGNIRGLISQIPATDFYPTPIQPASFYASLVDATETEPEHLAVQFQYQLNVDDSLLRLYPSQLIQTQLLNAVGLIDAFVAFSNMTTTGFKAALTTLYSNGTNKYNVTGLLVGAFALYDVTASAAITITSVVESAPGSGIYTFVIPTTATGHVLKLTPTSAGFDFKNVIATTFVI